jgi:hypothetical protein
MTDSNDNCTGFRFDVRKNGVCAGTTSNARMRPLEPGDLANELIWLGADRLLVIDMSGDTSLFRFLEGRHE